MTQPSVFLIKQTYKVSGHCGTKPVEDYVIYLNHVRLRNFSTHGNMSEGYWGTSAEPIAKTYAKAVADSLGVRVTRVKVK